MGKKSGTKSRESGFGIKHRVSIDLVIGIAGKEHTAVGKPQYFRCLSLWGVFRGRHNVKIWVTSSLTKILTTSFLSAMRIAGDTCLISSAL
jgi:hypothetical protein